MRLSKRWLLASCVASIAGAIAQPTLAQNAAKKDAPVATNEDEAPVIEQVTVTAERRATSIQDTPLAITAFTDKVRENIGISTIQDLTQFTPGVSYNAGSDRPTIRGIGRNTNNFGLDSPVANYIDDIYTSTARDTGRRPIFIDRTEIINGPQGALSGRGSAAGSINTFFKRPKDTFEAELGGYINNYERYGLEGTITGPVTDNMQYRLNGARYIQQKGYFTNAEDGHTQGNRAGNQYLFDAMLSGDLGSKLTYYLKASHLSYYESLRDNASLAPVVSGSNPCQPTAFPGGLTPSNTFGYFSPGPATQCGAVLVNGVPFDPQATIYGRGLKQNPVITTGDLRSFIDNYHADSGVVGYFNLTSDLTYHAPNANIRYIGSWFRYHYTQTADADGSAVNDFILPATVAGTANRRVNANGTTVYSEAPDWTSNELTIASTTDSKFSYVAGLYEFHRLAQQAPAKTIFPGFPELNSPTGAVANTRPFVAQYGEQDTTTESRAVFGQVDYKFNDHWRATLGLRYNSDQEKAVEFARFISNGFAGGANGITPTSQDVSAISAPGFAFVAANAPLAPGYRLIDLTGSQYTSSGAVTGGCPAGLYRTAGGITQCASAANAAALLGPGVVALPTVNPVTGDRERSSKGRWSALTGSVGLNYTPTEDSLIYVRLAKGYVPGGFGSGAAGFLGLNPYTNKQTLDSYEGGAKFTLWNKLQLNLALFRYNYKDFQASVTVFERCTVPTDITTCSATGQTTNLPSATNQGGELQGLWYVTNDLQLVLSYSYLDAHIKNGKVGLGFEDTNDPGAVLSTAHRLNPITCVTPGPLCVGGRALDSVTLLPRYTQDISGNDLPNAPHNKIAANLNYTFHLAPGNVTASYSYIWRSAAQSDLFGSTLQVTPAYSQSNARLIFRDKGQKLSIIVFAQNLFNQDVYEGGSSTRRGSGVTLAQQLAAPPGTAVAQTVTYYKNVTLIPPRVFGIEVLKRFR